MIPRRLYLNVPRLLSRPHHIANGPHTRCFNTSHLNRDSSTTPTKTTISISAILKNEEQDPKDLFDFEKKQYLDTLPPLMRSVKETMERYKSYVVITQVGSFYELYFEDATEVAPKLNLTLTRKIFKDDLVVPMAGFPLSQLDRHLKVLVKDLQLGVAISEQFKQETSIDNDPIRIARRVTRVISPGTLVDEAFLNEQENNYLLSIDFPKNSLNRVADPETPIGLAWIDISVGSLFVQETTLGGLASAISRIEPSEVLLSEDLVGYFLESGKWYQELIELKKYFIKYQNLPTKHKTMDLFHDMFNFPKTSIKRSFGDLSVKETAAMRSLLTYIQEHFPETTVFLQLPEKKLPEKIMQIDSRTSDTLELHKTYRDQLARGSLLSALRRTVTQAGSRLLSQWVMSPSTDVEEITARQRMVTTFYDDQIFRKEIIRKLRSSFDISRIVQRFSMGRGSTLDLVHLAHTVHTFESIKQIIHDNDQNLKTIGSILPIPESQLKLADEILRDIDVDHLMIDLENQQTTMKEELESLARDKQPPATSISKDPIYVVRKNASKELRSLHAKLENFQQEHIELQDSLRNKLLQEGSFKEVSLKFSPSLGYQVYVKGAKNSDYDMLPRVLSDAVPTQKSAYTRWYSYPKLTSLGYSIDAMQAKIRKEEDNVVKSLIKKVVKKSVELRKIGTFLDSLDVTSSFAVLASEKDFVCPVVDKSTDLEIVGGRHLVVEDSMKAQMKSFSSNDLFLNKESSSWVITGPNMGGKSTFLRQSAIITILAQCGSYVPAKSARIGIVDKIFSRVYSADDLSNNLSTFMVEMVETSYILNGATDRSLALLDEVGRGTSAKEGLALAFATLKHLGTVNKSRNLFSTHFGHEIDHLVKRHIDQSGLFKFKKTTVSKEGNQLYFNRHLVDGVSEQSYAIEVAEKAGFPAEALKFARAAMEDDGS